jgi:PAS domain S-box-containing protein
LFERRRQGRCNAELAAESGRRGQFIRTLLETIDVAVIAADPTGHLTVFNRAAREWHGLDADPTLDPADFSDRYALFEVDGVTRLTEDRIPLLRALHEGAVHDVEMVIRRRAGEPIHLSATGRALADPDGTLLGAVVAMNDVTADRAQRRALQEAGAELAERGAQLAATISELQRSNTELTDFATAVSHDLVSPLAAVHGCLDLLQQYSGDLAGEQARRWTVMALRAVVRMEQLIRALLDYARAGHVRLVPRPVDLDEVVGDAIVDLGTVMQAGDADVEIEDPLPTVAGDATLLRQLLQNLIGNAIKYRRPDLRCRVTIRARPYEHAWLVCVADNGIGIPPEHRERIFTMFAQVEPDKMTGHGIGLATCQRIVDRHGGVIWAEDTPGGGATINFTLPTG